MPLLTIFGSKKVVPLKPDPWWTYNNADFRAKRAREKIIMTVDFSAALSQGEAIVSAAWEVSDESGTAVPSMVFGKPTISGSVVSQMIVGGEAGAKVRPVCYATTSQGAGAGTAPARVWIDGRRCLARKRLLAGLRAARRLA